MRAAGVSKLAVRRWEFECGMVFGSAGTGGASTALGTCGDGDVSRKVRSDIELLLPLRSKAAPGGPLTDPAVELPMEEVEPALRTIRFVCTSATDIGVVGRDRRAAPAAAEASEALETWFLRKAWAAAVAALGLALLGLKGGYRECCVNELFSQTRSPETDQSSGAKINIRWKIPFSFSSQTCRGVVASPKHLCQPGADEVLLHLSKYKNFPLGAIELGLGG